MCVYMDLELLLLGNFLLLLFEGMLKEILGPPSAAISLVDQ